jgi:hypothetical protein
MKHPYDDIINLPHHVSERHPQMSMYNRAAQFAPFAALTGHNAAITEAARLTEAEQELSESDAEVLNRKLAYLQSLDEKPTISVTYFVPDDKKEGGSYHTATGIVKSVEPDKGVLQFEDGTGIPVIRIKDIDGECFLTE